MFNFGKSKRIEVLAELGDQVGPAIVVDQYHKPGTMVCSSFDVENKQVSIRCTIPARRFREFKSRIKILENCGIKVWIREIKL